MLGVQVVRQQDQLDDMESALEETTLQAAANQAFDDPDAVKVQLQSSDGDVTGRAVVLPDGTGYLMAHELPGLDGDRTYQLWGDTGAAASCRSACSATTPPPSPSRPAPTSRPWPSPPRRPAA